MAAHYARGRAGGPGRELRREPLVARDPVAVAQPPAVARTLPAPRQPRGGAWKKKGARHAALGIPHRLVMSPQLNLNFNRITSLEGLQCNGLEKLFLAGNSVRRCPMQASASLAHDCCVLWRVDRRRLTIAAAAQTQHRVAVRQPDRGPRRCAAYVSRSTPGAIAVPNSQRAYPPSSLIRSTTLSSCARWTWVAIRARASSRATSSA